MAGQLISEYLNRRQDMEMFLRDLKILFKKGKNPVKEQISHNSLSDLLLLFWGVLMQMHVPFKG